MKWPFSIVVLCIVLQNYVTYAQFPWMRRGPFPMFPRFQPPFSRPPQQPQAARQSVIQARNGERLRLLPSSLATNTQISRRFNQQSRRPLENNIDLSQLPDFNSRFGAAAGSQLINQLSSAPSENGINGQRRTQTAFGSGFQNQARPNTAANNFANRFQRTQTQNPVTQSRFRQFGSNVQSQNNQPSRTQITFPSQANIPLQTQQIARQRQFATFPQNPFQLASFPNQFIQNQRNSGMPFQPQGVAQFPQQQQRTTAQQQQMQRQQGIQSAFARNIQPQFPGIAQPNPFLTQGATQQGANQQRTMPQVPTRQFPSPQQIQRQPQQSLQGLQNLLNPLSPSTAGQQPPTAAQSFPSAAQPFPSAAQPFPGAVQPFPGVAQPLPGAAQPLPGAAQPLPGVAQTLPAAAQPLPGVSQALPGATGAGTPSSVSATPGSTASGNPLFSESAALAALGINPESLNPNTFSGGSTSSSGTSDGKTTITGPGGQELTPVDPNNIPPGAEVQSLITITDDQGNILYQGVDLSPEEIDKIANEIAQNLTKGNPAGSPPVDIVDAGTINLDSAASSGAGQTSSVPQPSGVLPQSPSGALPQLPSGALPQLPSNDLSQFSASSNSFSPSSSGGLSNIIGGGTTFAGGNQQSQQPSFPSQTVVDFANPNSQSSQSANTRNHFMLGSQNDFSTFLNAREPESFADATFLNAREPETFADTNFLATQEPWRSHFAERRGGSSSAGLFRQFLNNPDQFAHG